MSRPPRGGLGDNGAVITFRRSLVAVSGALAAAAALAPAVLAHGAVAPTAPTLADFVFGWRFDPTIWLPAIVALLLWRSGAARANRNHPANPVARRRTWLWTAGVLVVVAALDSGIEHYDTALFSVHMVQHMLLTLIAPPLLLLAGPITLVLQASSATTRQRWVLPLLHARIVRAISHPVVAWLVFAAVMWGTHFSPLFDASLENVWIHRAEHGLFITAALLFWWPAVGTDPSPWRLGAAVRPLYIGLQMPQNTFLAVAIYAADAPLYAHYVSNIRAWGPTPLEDQQLAGGIMWMGGDIVFIVAVILLVAAWMRDEQRRAPAEDKRVEPERAAINERAARLAQRKAAEASDGAPPL